MVLFFSSAVLTPYIAVSAEELSPATGTLPDDLVKLREQVDELLRPIIAVEFAHGLSAVLAIRRELLSSLDHVFDPWDEYELQPLAEGHGVHGECLAKFVLLWPQRFALPIADPFHFLLDLGNLRLNAFLHLPHRCSFLLRRAPRGNGLWCLKK